MIRVYQFWHHNLTLVLVFCQKSLLTSSIVSGSEADASHLLFRIKMFGRERRWLTLWKKFFSCRKERDEGLKAMLHEAIFLATCNATNVALQVARKNSSNTPFCNCITSCKKSRTNLYFSHFARQVACV